MILVSYIKNQDHCEGTFALCFLLAFVHLRSLLHFQLMPVCGARIQFHFLEDGFSVFSRICIEEIVFSIVCTGCLCQRLMGCDAWLYSWAFYSATLFLAPVLMTVYSVLTAKTSEYFYGIQKSYVPNFSQSHICYLGVFCSSPYILRLKFFTYLKISIGTTINGLHSICAFPWVLWMFSHGSSFNLEIQYASPFTSLMHFINDSEWFSSVQKFNCLVKFILTRFFFNL